MYTPCVHCGGIKHKQTYNYKQHAEDIGYTHDEDVAPLL